MRLAPLLLIVALAAPCLADEPAKSADSYVILVEEPADSGAKEIVLVGENPAPPPAPPDIARSAAVEEFLSARQDASVDRSLAGQVRREMATSVHVADDVLLGPSGASMVAFDFDDGDIRRAEGNAGRFTVTSTVIFASADGQIIESRDEELTFVASGSGYACAKIAATNVISWEATAAQRASDAGIARDMEGLKEYWRRPSNPGQSVAYSVSDVERRPDGDVVVSCIRYTANAGKRGFQTEAASVVITKQDGSFQLKPH